MEKDRKNISDINDAGDDDVNVLNLAANKVMEYTEEAKKKHVKEYPNL